MEDRGLVRRTILPPPAGSTVYELTELGQELEPVVMALGRFGAHFLGPLRDSDRLLPSTLFVAMRARFRSDIALGLHDTYEFHVDGHVFEVVVDDGACRTREGQAHAPNAVFTMDVRTLYALLREGLSAEEAIRRGRVQVKGDAKLLARWAQLFQLLQPAAAAR
jgi:putative sterol carrier protein